jgi:hypothetical protein
MNETTDFESMCWHDNAIHGISIREGNDGYGAELDLDIDYILEWIAPENNSFSFRIAPVTLTFHEVSDLIISVNYAITNTLLQQMIIHEIQREVHSYPNGDLSFSWKIDINWPPNSFITFVANGFTQEQHGEPVISGAQYLSPSERRIDHT